MKNINNIVFNEETCKTREFSEYLKLNNAAQFYYGEIMKSSFFSFHKLMDWLIGDWVFMCEKDMNPFEDEKIKVPKISANVISNKDYEKILNLFKIHWPFKVNIEYKEYNVLPLFNYDTEAKNDIDIQITNEYLYRILCERISKDFINPIDKIITKNDYWVIKSDENIKYLRFDKRNSIKTEYNQIVL